MHVCALRVRMSYAFRIGEFCRKANSISVTVCPLKPFYKDICHPEYILGVCPCVTRVLHGRVSLYENLF